MSIILSRKKEIEKRITHFVEVEKEPYHCWQCNGYIDRDNVNYCPYCGATQK
jgi:rubrerythrin